jgi:hypothetical protein
VPPLLAGARSKALISLCNFNEVRLLPEDMSDVQVNHPILDGGGHN